MVNSWPGMGPEAVCKESVDNSSHMSDFTSYHFKLGCQGLRIETDNAQVPLLCFENLDKFFKPGFETFCILAEALNQIDSRLSPWTSHSTGHDLQI